MSESPDSFIPEGIFLLFAPGGNLAGLSYGRIAEGGQRRAVDSPSCTSEYHQLILLNYAGLLLLGLHELCDNNDRDLSVLPLPELILGS